MKRIFTFSIVGLICLLRLPGAGHQHAAHHKTTAHARSSSTRRSQAFKGLLDHGQSLYHTAGFCKQSGMIISISLWII